MCTWEVLLLFSLCGGNTIWGIQTGPKLWACGLYLDASKRKLLSGLCRHWDRVELNRVWSSRTTVLAHLVEVCMECVWLGGEFGFCPQLTWGLAFVPKRVVRFWDSAEMLRA